MEKDSRSSSKEFKRKQIFDKHHPQPTNAYMKNDSSNLRMFLEELKNEENNNSSNRQHLHNQQLFLKSNHQGSPSNLSSMGSSANIEILKMQEESFSKIHNDISSLQNKIKGLENKLGPQHRQNQQIQKEKKFQEKSENPNKRYFDDENRIKSYKTKQPQFQNVKEKVKEYKQERSYISGNYNSFKENKENYHHFNPGQVDSEVSSESDSQSYQTFPLRLKKQYLQQQLDLENKRVQLNDRFNLPKQVQQPLIRERYEAINDSVEIHDNGQEIEFNNQVRSLTESDQEQSYQHSEGVQMNDSTISVSEKMKSKIKEKIMKYKSNQRRRSQSRQNSQKSLTASLKRSNTQDFSKRNTGTKVKRQVRFSETKRSSRSKERRNSQNSNETHPQDMLEVRKSNAYLKMELDKMRKKYEMREDYYSKWRDIKIQNKELREDYKKQDLKRKEQKEVIEEQKKIITKLKKKVKLQKEKLKKLVVESPVRSEHPRTALKTTKSYKQFKNDEKEVKKQKSHRKLQPSDIGQNRSKVTKIKRF